MLIAIDLMNGVGHDALSHIEKTILMILFSIFVHNTTDRTRVPSIWHLKNVNLD